AVIDEVTAARRFQQRWREALEHLGEDSAARPAFARALRLGMTPDAIETLARDLWLRPDIADIARAMPGSGPAGWPDLQGALDGLRALPIDDKPADDPLGWRLRKLRDLLEVLVAAGDGEREALLAGGGMFEMKFNRSSQRV